MRQQMMPTWRVHGVITDGGVKPNIIPDFTESEWVIRTPNEEQMKELHDKVAGCFEGCVRPAWRRRVGCAL